MFFSVHSGKSRRVAESLTESGVSVDHLNTTTADCTNCTPDGTLSSSTPDAQVSSLIDTKSRVDEHRVFHYHQERTSSGLVTDYSSLKSSQSVNELGESSSPREDSVTEETISADGCPSDSLLSTPPNAISSSATIDGEEYLNGGGPTQYRHDSILCEIVTTSTADANDEEFHNFSSSALIDADQDTEIQRNKMKQHPVSEHSISKGGE
ncbi:hypothetical protein QAD02_007538 [Eretmocerus hayati]|uniref:Uncharacterized protein n=1 Tax=Eretmocerus hayati TaxID=131215 RepID=A0ACC2N5A1_9HYME|nr:hypothetical protein QAD02_007538 [Eretmocerus hayati]